MSSSSSSSSSGIGFIGLLTILFVGLKLTGHIDWSWWWVLSPLWLPATVILGVFLLALLALYLISLVSGPMDRRWDRGWFRARLKVNRD